MDPQVGQLINNKYRLARLIGDGGMGSVFEAKHELLGTTVALKFLHAALSRRKGLVERFLQEAQVSARIKSPHVVSVSDVDRAADGLAYMVMEYVEGETLQTLYEKLYNKNERLSYGDAFDIMLQMLEGVSAAHALGIIHRDLKPDNVMLTDDGRGGRLVKILDFGIAKLKASGEVDRGLTRPGVVMGTPEYMAPEQAFSADKVDARADVFSLGVMFFEMLAGRRPVGGDNAHAIAAQYLEGSIAQLRDLTPSVAPKLATAVHKAMGAKPDERFDTVDAFRNAIAPYAPDGAGTAASKSETPDPLAMTAPSQREDGDSPVPKTVPPEQTFSDTDEDSVAARTAGGSDSASHSASDSASDSASHSASHSAASHSAASHSAASHSAASHSDSGDGTTAQMRAVEDQRPDPTEHQSPLRAGTEPMAEGAVQAQMAMRAAEGNRPSGSTQVGEPFAPPGYGAPPAMVGAGPAAVAPAYSPPAGRSAKKKGPPLLAILLIAAGVSAAVVGGVYVAHQAGAREAEDEDPIDVSPPPVATVVENTPPTEPPTPTITPPTTPPPTPPPVSQPPPQPPPPTTQPKPQPPAQPPPTKPQPPPPFIIPSALPGLPGIPGLTPPQPPPPTTQPPPPPPSGKGKPTIFKPGGDGQPGTQSSTGGATGTTRPKPTILRPGTLPKLLPGSDGGSSKSDPKDGSSSDAPKRPSVLFPKLRR